LTDLENYEPDQFIDDVELFLQAVSYDVRMKPVRDIAFMTVRGLLPKAAK
jgi:hypothetical protein